MPKTGPLAVIDPGPEIDRHKKHVVVLVEEANSFAIRSEADYSDAADLIRDLADRYDRIEAARTDLTKPLNEVLKKINAAFKPMQNEIDAAKKRVRGLMTAWTIKKRQEAEQLAAKQRTAQAEMGMAVTAVVADPAQPQGVATRKDLKYEVTDIEKVPLDFITVDDKLVREALKKGETIPGIRSWVEESVVVKR